MTYLTKRDKNKQNIEEDEDINIILQDEKKDKEKENKINEELPLLNDLIKDK